MNNRLLGISMLLMTFCCTAVSAQESSAPTSEKMEIPIEGGIKSDLIFMNFMTKKAPAAVSTFAPGGCVGGFVHIRFSENISIQPELNINYKRSRFGWAENSGNWQSWGVEVPIYVMGGWDTFKDQRLYFGIGPYTEFYYFAQWQFDGRRRDLLQVNDKGEPMIQDTQSGIGAVFCYEFGNGIRINLTYRICFYNILQPNSSQGVSLYPQSAAIGIAYNFKKKA